MPSFPVSPEPLTDGVVSLRRSAERDIPEVLIAYQDDPGLHRSLGEPRPPSGAILGRRAELARHELDEGRAITFTIVLAGSDICQGEVRVAEADWAGGHAVLRVWVAPQLRGRGLGRRAHALARAWLQQACGLSGVCPAPASRDLAG
jgi:RimJ/RimL family protein N-acetyltransferase